MLESEQVLLIVYFIGVCLALVLFVVVFFVAFLRRKNKFLIERMEARRKFERELADTRLEIQEQTFKNIAWELHDNVGQLLSVANIQLGMMQHGAQDSLQDQIKETKDVIRSTVEEVRSLSKTLNTDVVLNNGLQRSIELELERFERLNFLTPHFEARGEQQSIRPEDEIIIFRILQEFFSNVMKHARANNLFVTLNYQPDRLVVNLRDDGVGFDDDQKHESSGLVNMRSRASLLGADLSLTSTMGTGTELKLIYPYRPHESKR